MTTLWKIERCKTERALKDGRLFRTLKVFRGP